MNYKHRLQKAFKDVPCIPLSEHSKYILISDCHRGNGSSSDNFLKNQHLYFAALQYYYKNGYSYIELGDGDELWENRSIKQIIEVHSNVFWLLSKLYEEGRLYLLYGNHDMIKKYPKKVQQNFQSYTCPSGDKELPLFPDIIFYSGLILRDQEKKKDIYLTHGHQTNLLNSDLWKVNRFLVRYLWRPAEQLGFLDPTSAAKNNKKKRKTEEKLTEWAKKEGHILITGHTHRPMIGTKDAPYCNTGSCVHPRCITCIEIEHRCMTLVKWTVTTRADRSLYVAREVLAEPICIDEYAED